MLDQALIVLPGIVRHNKDTNIKQYNAASCLLPPTPRENLSSPLLSSPEVSAQNKALYVDFLGLEIRAVEEGLLGRAAAAQMNDKDQ